MKRNRYGLSSIVVSALAAYGCTQTTDAGDSEVGVQSSAIVLNTDIVLCRNNCGLTNSASPDVPVFLSYTMVPGPNNRPTKQYDAAVIFACGANNGVLTDAFNYPPGAIDHPSFVYDNYKLLEKAMNHAPILVARCDQNAIAQVFRRTDPAQNQPSYLAQFAEAPDTLFSIDCANVLGLWGHDPTPENVTRYGVPIDADNLKQWGNRVQIRPLHCYSAPSKPPKALPPPSATIQAGRAAASNAFALYWVTGGDGATTTDLYAVSGNDAFLIDCGANVYDAIGAFGGDPTTIPTRSIADLPSGRRATIKCDTSSAQVVDTVNSPSNRYVDFVGDGASMFHFTCETTNRTMSAGIPPEATYRVPEESVPFLSLSASTPSAVFDVGCIPRTFVRWETREGAMWNGMHWFAGDFDGDHKTDIGKQYWAAYNGSTFLGVDVHLSTGSSFQLNRFYTSPPGHDNPTWLAGDYDGDGLSDLAEVWNDHGAISITVYRSDGKQLTPQSWVTRDGAPVDGQQWVAGDFDGDGRTDIGTAFNDGNMISIDVYSSTPQSRMIQRRRWETKTGGWNAAGHYLAGDFNADGKADIAHAFPENYAISIDVHVSNGQSMTMQRWATQDGGFAADHRWLAGDFDGDGRSDIMTVWNDNGQISLDAHYAGAGAFSRVRVASQTGGAFDAPLIQWLAGDFTGSGRSAVAKVTSDNQQSTVDVFRP